jgi:hypothetical protein
MRRRVAHATHAHTTHATHARAKGKGEEILCVLRNDAEECFRVRALDSHLLVDVELLPGKCMAFVGTPGMQLLTCMGELELRVSAGEPRLLPAAGTRQRAQQERDALPTLHCSVISLAERPLPLVESLMHPQLLEAWREAPPALPEECTLLLPDECAWRRLQVTVRHLVLPAVVVARAPGCERSLAGEQVLFRPGEAGLQVELGGISFRARGPKFARDAWYYSLA